MLNQPEFHDIERVRSLLSLIEKEQDVLKLFQSSKAGISIKIGKENDYEEMENCSLITATYTVDTKQIGFNRDYRADAHELFKSRQPAAARDFGLVKSIHKFV